MHQFNIDSEELQLRPIETIKTINFDNVDDGILDEVIPEIEPFWIPLFPEHKIFRYLSVDDITVKEEKNSRVLLYRPIIFINGYQSSHKTWNFFAQKIWNAGYRSIFALNLENEFLELEKFYLKLDEVIETILSFLHIFKSVIIIGHSLGGTLARYYIKRNELRGKHNVSLLITLASPHYGILKSFRHFESIFKLVFRPEAVNLFSLEKGVHVDINKYNPENEDFLKVTMINIQGSMKRLAGGDGIFKPEPVSEMINYTAHKHHFRIHKSHKVFNLIENFLNYSNKIFKIRLENIKFPSIEILHKFYVYFIIKVDDIEQKFPVLDELEINPNDSSIIKPVIIFSGAIDQKINSEQNNKEKIVILSLFRKKRLINEKFIEISLPIKLEKGNNPTFETKTFENQIVSLSINLLTYKPEVEN